MANTSSPQKMKIAIVFDDSLDKPDGVQQYILSLGSWLIRQGHEVHYLVGQTARTDIPNIRSLSKNVGVTFNGNKLSIPLPVGKHTLKNLLDREKYDVLHVQMPYSPWMAHRLIVSAPPETAIFATFHIVAYSAFVKTATKFLAVWTRRSQKRLQQVVSVSAAAQQYALETYGITSEVVPNVFDYPRFSEATALLESVRPNKRILFLGRLVERKGCQYLLEALSLLKLKGIDNFEATICGKGHLSDSLQDYAKRHGLPVRFTGFVSEEDKPGYFASADIAVFPSTGGESFGIVLVEAMASGRAAVIGADNSGYASVLHDREDLQFEAANASKLANALEKLLCDDKYRQEAAAWGKQYARRFDVAIVGKQLTTMYETGIIACTKQTRRR